jgi:hypothetical protein
MAVTRAQVEAILISRVGGWLVLSDLDGTTVDGTNAALNDAIGFAIRLLGGTTANPALITDADLATVDDADLDKLLDIAEYRALYSAQGALFIDAKAGPVEAKRSAHGARLAALVSAKGLQLAVLYGIGAIGALGVSMRRVDGYTCTDGDS